MKTTDKAYNPILDNDIIAYRIVQQFKMCLEKDEWHISSSEKEKNVVFVANRELYDGLHLAVISLKNAGYNVEAKQLYFGSPIPIALSYYPNKETI